MKIIVDVMGGDNSPVEQIVGAIEATKIRNDFDLILTGDEKVISQELSKLEYDKSRVEIVHCDEVIEQTDSPVIAIRTKKESSMVKSLYMIKHKEADLMLSCGNTGALAVGSQLILGRFKGINRPALTALLPNENSFTLLLDAGVNPSCKAVNYPKFSIMGYHYMKDICNVENPNVYLLNVGAEEKKGTEVLKKAHQLMKEVTPNFKGNIEGREILTGKADVVVCDGYGGNVAIKTIEGAADFMISQLKGMLMGSFATKIAALILKPSLKKFKKKLDTSEYGGAPMLGVKGKVIKCHGGAKARAITVAITKFGCKYAQSDILTKLENEFKDLDLKDDEND